MLGDLADMRRRPGDAWPQIQRQQRNIPMTAMLKSKIMRRYLLAGVLAAAIVPPIAVPSNPFFQTLECELQVGGGCAPRPYEENPSRAPYRTALSFSLLALFLAAGRRAERAHREKNESQQLPQTTK